MITVALGTRAVLELIDGRFLGIRGTIEYVNEYVVAVRLDDDQPPKPLPPLTRVEFTVDADSGKKRFKSEIYDTQSGGRRLRLLKPDDLVSRDRRAHERITLDRPVLWSQLTEDGQLTTHRHGIARDISVGGIRFETVSRPPKVGSIVAVSSVDNHETGAVLVCVVGLDDVPTQKLRHVVRCSLDLAQVQNLATPSGFVEMDRSTPLPDLFEQPPGSVRSSPLR